MSKRETSSEISAAAAAWVARADRAPLSPSDAEALNQWLVSDSRRRGAYAKAQAVWAYTDRAAGLRTPAGPHIPFAPIEDAALMRRRVLFGGVGATLAAGLGALAVFVPPLLQGAPLKTKKGEVRLQPMPDGSTITLNTQTLVQVRYSAKRREVELLAGEALFDVAKDRTRPFVVKAGNTLVRAVGTSFVVRRSADAVSVLVREGVVDVFQTDATVRPARLTANASVTARPNDPVLRSTELPPAEVMRRVAWRDGLLDFEGMTLAQAANEFGRYSNERIDIPDSSLGDTPITGLFSANDPEGFVRAAALSIGAQVEKRGELLIITKS